MERESGEERLESVGKQNPGAWRSVQIRQRASPLCESLQLCHICSHADGTEQEQNAKRMRATWTRRFQSSKVETSRNTCTFPRGMNLLLRPGQSHVLQLLMFHDFELVLLRMLRQAQHRCH